jgi:hypothetical protein
VPFCQSRLLLPQAFANSNPEMKVSWAESHGRKNLTGSKCVEVKAKMVWMDDGFCNDIGFRGGHRSYGEIHVPIGMVY